ncbi:multi antimicrobial extrusion protein (Na(+)/drug antiporter) [Klebsiella pneumoniae]|nr:multi antimicrobial extrusion protein (Na(+)/drug antiporter) [Klebsiella pneumoniae]
MGFIGLLVNIPVNYIFIYGHFGMPELGGVGCGVATASVYWVMFASMLWWVRRGAYDARYPLRRALQRP